MRYGKKLALQAVEDQSGAPYLSHRPMKEAINGIVRELRLYQQRAQGVQTTWSGGGAYASTAELGEIAARICEFDRRLFLLVDEDLERIQVQVRCGEERLSAGLAALQHEAVEVGVLVKEAQLERLEKALPKVPENRTLLCQQLLELRLRSDPLACATDIQRLATQHNDLVELANQHAQYVEINIAGFRKLLKRHEKQVPQQFRTRPMPCLRFHKLVTRTSQELLDLTQQVSGLVVDAKQRFENVVPYETATQVFRSVGYWTNLCEPRGLGPECQMVLCIQKQLRDSRSGGQLMQAQVPACLYPKPGAAWPEGVSASGGPLPQMGQAFGSHCV